MKKLQITILSLIIIFSVSFLVGCSTSMLKFNKDESSQEEDVEAPEEMTDEESDQTEKEVVEKEPKVIIKEIIREVSIPATEEKEPDPQSDSETLDETSDEAEIIKDTESETEILQEEIVSPPFDKELLLSRVYYTECGNDIGSAFIFSTQNRIFTQGNAESCTLYLNSIKRFVAHPQYSYSARTAEGYTRTKDSIQTYEPSMANYFFIYEVTQKYLPTPKLWVELSGSLLKSPMDTYTTLKQGDQAWVLYFNEEKHPTFSTIEILGAWQNYYKIDREINGFLVSDNGRVMGISTSANSDTIVKIDYLRERTVMAGMLFNN